MITHAAVLGPDGEPVFLAPPARHHDIINHMVDVLCHPIPIIGRQGFMDDRRGFVGRLQAADIARFESHQITDLKWPPNLYSEDLW